MSGVLSKKLNYADRAPHALPSETVMMKCLPVSGSTFTSGSTIRIMIPHRAGCYLKPDSYLQLTLNNNTALKVELDGCISSAFSRIATFQGSQLISDLQGYNMLKNVVLDTQASAVQRTNGSLSIMMGTAGHYHEGDMNANLGLLDFRGGQIIAPGSADFCTVILNSVFSSAASKYIPLCKLNDGLIIELTLADFKNAFIARANNAAAPVQLAQADAAFANLITISNVSFIANCVQLGDVAQSLVERMPDQGVYEIASKDWKLYNAPIVAGASTASILVPARFQSISTFLAWFHEDALINNSGYRYLTSRSRNALSTYQLRLNGVPFPSQPIVASGNGSQAYAEMEKTINSLTSTLHSVSLQRSEWINDAAGGHGAFVIGANLDSLAFAAEQPTFNGVRTVDGNTFLDLTFNAGAALTGKYYAAVQHDVVLLIDSEGNMSVKF